MGQMANQATLQHKSGLFPSNTKVNTKDHCNAIQLRGGTTYMNHQNLNLNRDEEVIEVEDEKEISVATEETKSMPPRPVKSTSMTPPSVPVNSFVVPNISYALRLVKAKA